MNRAYISRRIRRHGATYILKHPTATLQGDTVQPFSAYLKGLSLWVNALELPTGSLIAPLARPDREYIVAHQEDKTLFEEYQLHKINCRGSLARSATEAPRDTFGRSVADTAISVYLDLPLYLHQSANPNDATSPAISSTTVYRFTVPVTTKNKRATSSPVALIYLLIYLLYTIRI